MGCLSFEETDIDLDTKRKIIDEFETLLLGGYKERFNVLWVQHVDKARLELNFAIPKIDIESSMAFNPYYDKVDRPLIDTWQNYVNLKFGFTDPKDPVKVHMLQGSRKEIGVNLALGVSKAKIVGQFILELVIISIPSFIVSYFIGKAVSQSIGNQILSQSIKSVTESVANQTKGLNLGANAEVEGASKMITSLDVSVNLTDMMSVVGIGLAVIVIAICITSIRLIYKKPKELLQNIN